MKGKLGKLTLMAITIVLIAVGCSPSAALPTSTTEPTASPEPIFPIGIYTKGNWTVEYRSDGTYHAEQQMADDDGTYTVTGNQIAIEGDFVPCRGIVGIYTWIYDGTALTFTTVEDKCAERRNVTGYGKWVKKP